LQPLWITNRCSGFHPLALIAIFGLIAHGIQRKWM
jgi:hypothetical protein